MIKALRVVALGFVALAAAGCAGTSSQSVGATVATGSYVAYARCLSRHGVSASAGQNGGFVIKGEDPGSPVFRAAQTACRASLPAGGTAPAPVSESQRRALLAFAACMRRHGLPDWADPSFPPGGGVMAGGSSGYGKDSPAVRGAALTCNKHSSSP